MKKYFLFIFITGVLLSASDNIYSQESNTSKWNFGITAGPQFTNVSLSGLPTSSNNEIGYMVGIFGEYNLFDNFKIKAGLNFDKRSFSANYQSLYLVFQDTIISRNSYTAYDFKYNLDFLTIPISFIYTKGEGKFKLLVQGTAYYSLFLTAHQNGFTDIYIDEDYFQYVDNDLHPNIQAGHNRHDYTGTTDSFLESENFNTSDFGLNIFIGGIYYISEKVGIYLSPGFTVSFGKVIENPVYDSKWMNIFKIETGIFIHLN